MITVWPSDFAFRLFLVFQIHVLRIAYGLDSQISFTKCVTTQEWMGIFTRISMKEEWNSGLSELGQILWIEF